MVEGSTTYELIILHFKSGTPEEHLTFLHSMKRVIQGQNTTQDPSKCALLRQLLQGDALSAFERALLMHGSETNDNFDHCLNDLTMHVFPRHTLASQKHHMRCVLRKSCDMKVREFMTCLVELNDMLEEFPLFADKQKIEDDELLGIAKFATPHTWKKQMALQGFDPMDHVQAKFTKFCKCIEFNEQTHDKGPKAQPKLKLVMMT